MAQWDSAILEGGGPWVLAVTFAPNGAEAFLPLSIHFIYGILMEGTLDQFQEGGLDSRLDNA